MPRDEPIMSADEAQLFAAAAAPTQLRGAESAKVSDGAHSEQGFPQQHQSAPSQPASAILGPAHSVAAYMHSPTEVATSDELQGPMTKKSEMSHKSYKRERSLEAAQKLVPGTTLGANDWEMIEDSLLPFEITAVLICLGAFALIGLSIYVYVDPVIYPAGEKYLNGYSLGPLWTFMLSLPLIVGICQIGLAIGFGLAARFEHWAHISIQDVIRHNLPGRIGRAAAKVPLRCEARRAYILFMFMWVTIQIIAASTVMYTIDRIEVETNAGNVASAESGVIADTLRFTSAVFNECCASEGWSRQGQLLPCPAGGSTKSVANCTIPAAMVLFQAQLCACYPETPEQHAVNRAYVRDSGLCEIGKNMLVAVSNEDNIPGTSLAIRSFIPSAFPKVPMVGPPGNGFYGCGLGFYRGLQWTLSRWVTQTFRPVLLYMILVSLAQLLFLWIGSCVVFRVKHRTFRYDDEGVPIGPVHPHSPQDGPRLGLRGVLDSIRDGTFSPRQVVALSPAAAKYVDWIFSPSRPKTDSQTVLPEVTNLDLESPATPPGLHESEERRPGVLPESVMSREFMVEAVRPTGSAPVSVSLPSNGGSPPI